MSQFAAASADHLQPAITSSFARRWWFPLTTLVVGSVLLAIVCLKPSFEPGHRNIAKFAAVGLTWTLLTGWFFFFSHFRRKTRMSWLVAEMVVIALLLINFRIESFDGEVNPKIVSRWTPKKDTLLKAEHPTVTPLTAEPVQPIDLTQKSDHDFSQFLGENRRGVIEGLHLARDWSKTPPRLVWRQPIGAGWSAFSVVGDFACTQEQRGDEELVTCYELKTGKLRWLHSDTQRYNSVLAGDGPRGTPTIADGRVYTLGPTGHLLCLDGANEPPSWKQVGAPYGLSEKDAANQAETMRRAFGRTVFRLIVEETGSEDAAREELGALRLVAGKAELAGRPRPGPPPLAELLEAAD